MQKRACLSFLLFLCLFSLVLPWRTRSATKVDPHGREGMCDYCHKFKEMEKDKAGFDRGTVEATCLECHGDKDSTLEGHLQRTLPSIRLKERLIVYFSKHPDFSCHSCHYVMCQSNSREQLKRRNPHIQLDTKKKPIKKRCLFCHAVMPDYVRREGQDAVMRYDLSYLCSLCHVMQSKRGGLGLGEKMTQEMIQTKKEFETKYDVSLPLGPNNTVICASCHNPHQFGVILGKGGYAAPPGKHRLIVEDPWRLCAACHSWRYYK